MITKLKKGMTQARQKLSIVSTELFIQVVNYYSSLDEKKDDRYEFYFPKLAENNGEINMCTVPQEPQRTQLLHWSWFMFWFEQWCKITITMIYMYMQL